jgi:hypothetical protein
LIIFQNEELLLVIILLNVYGQNGTWINNSLMLSLSNQGTYIASLSNFIIIASKALTNGINKVHDQSRMVDLIDVTSLNRTSFLCGPQYNCS